MSQSPTARPPDDDAAAPESSPAADKGNSGPGSEGPGSEAPAPEPVVPPAARSRRARSRRRGSREAVGPAQAYSPSTEADREGGEQPDDAVSETELPGTGPEEPAPAFRRSNPDIGIGMAYSGRYMRQRERILRGMRSGPPRRPWDRFKRWLDDQGPARVSLTLIFLGTLLLAVYLGLALGDSIEKGRGNGAQAGVAALPTTTPGVGQIACGSGSYTIEQGRTYSLMFDSKALAGYQISNLSIRPVSANASAQSLEAQARPPFAVEVTALSLPGSAGRTDEYRLAVTFSKVGERDVTSECTVLVHGPSTTATAQPSPSPQPTATPTERPVIAPTQPPPTQTPAPASPTSTSTPPPLSPTRTSTAAATPTYTPGP